jgi:hypothetical protein
MGWEGRIIETGDRAHKNRECKISTIQGATITNKQKVHIFFVI